jgi:hypothetical protein
MTAWLKNTRAAVLIGTLCLGGLALGVGCNKGDEGSDAGDSAKQKNKDRYQKPIQDKPVGEGARLVVPGGKVHA